MVKKEFINQDHLFKNRLPEELYHNNQFTKRKKPQKKLLKRKKRKDQVLDSNEKSNINNTYNKWWNYRQCKTVRSICSKCRSSPDKNLIDRKK